MGKKVLVLASNLGLWAEELQAPWDALKKAGCEVTLATEQGKTPLPMVLSVDRGFVDPVQKYNVNPEEVVDRVEELLEKGEWDSQLKIADARMSDYDALALVGGPGSPLDLVGNSKVHALVLEAFRSGKIIGAICYAVGALAMTRDPENDNKSVILGKSIVAHPREWDFTGDLNYPLAGATPENPGTDLVTPGFLFPLQPMVEDAVGAGGKVIADPGANREKPVVHFDRPFVTAQSVESSIAFGEKMAEVLSQAD
jgi:putative intracellular protease/amidase